MNNDDNFKDTNHHLITPELEARVVAWVLGEASDFEATVLEKLCAESPELAAFKRHIETVNGLVEEAAKPPKEPLRLSPQRRAKVLAAIGRPTPSFLAAEQAQKPRRSWHSWALPMAACLTMMVLLAAVMIPTVGKVQQTARKSKEVSDRRQAEQLALIEASTSANHAGSRDVVDASVGPVRQERPSGQGDHGQAKYDQVSLVGSVGAPASPSTSSAYAGGMKDSLGLVSVDTATASTPVDATTFNFSDQGEVAKSTVAGEVRHRRALEGSGKDAYASPEAATNGFATGMAMPVASKPVNQPQSVTITAGSPQEFDVHGFTQKKQEDERADRDLHKVSRNPLAFGEKLRSEIPTVTEAISTFSLHVSDASFRLAKAALARGQAPDPTTIRPEEFYNAFDYGDPSPVAGEPVSCRIEQAAHPFLQQRNLVRVAMQVPAAGRVAGTPLRLTVLLDTSGSMEREDRAATVRAAFTSLASLLGPNDRVTLIGFARTPRLLAESVAGDQAAKLIELAAGTPAEGGTNMEEALKLAGNLALRQKLAGAQNRIVVLTDGAANLGDADPEQLAKHVEALRQNGIAFDACGVVADGLDDSVLEALTRKGDGRYTILNSPEEADARFARQLAGAFRPAAKDVKVQVRFNPARVACYRLIGFEQHRLKTEDFRNDKIDAAELAAEEAAVAVYQVEVRPEGEGELGDVSVRFLDTRSNERVERTWTLAYAAQPAAFARATPSLQLAGSAAFLAEKLRGGALAGQIRMEEFAPVVEGLAGHYASAPRVQEFITMFRQARRLTGE